MAADPAVANVDVDKPRAATVKRRIKARAVEVKTFNQFTRTLKADFGYRDVRRSSEHVLRIRNAADFGVVRRATVSAVQMN